MSASPLTQLQEADAAQRRGELSQLADDRPLVGVVGPDVPTELVHAAGFQAIRLCGQPGSATPRADRYLEPMIDGEARSVLERILDGTYAQLDHLALCHDRESTVRLFYYLRELQRVEPDLGLPDLTFVDVLHQPSRTSTMYTFERLHDFAEVLATWSGAPVEDAAVRSAIDLANRCRRLLRRISEFRSEPSPRCTGTEALAINSAGMALPRERYVELLEALVDELGAREPLDRREPVRVFVTGTTHDGPGTYRGIEAAGATIVGEDHDRGLPHLDAEVDPDADPFRALAMHYQFRTDASPLRSIQQRADATTHGAIQTGAQAVVCVLRMGDDAPYWDVSEQRRQLAEHGVPIHVLELDGYRHELTEDEIDSLARFHQRVRDDAGREVASAGPTDVTPEVAP